MRQPRESATNGLWYVLTPLGETTDMHFVNHEVAPFDERTPGRLEQLRHFDDGLWNKRRAVDIVFGRAMDPCIEQTCIELERAIELRRVGIDQQFGAIETVTGPRLEWTVRAQAVAGAGADARDMPMKHIAQPAG